MLSQLLLPCVHTFVQYKLVLQKKVKKLCINGRRCENLQLQRFCRENLQICGSQKAANFCHPVKGFSDHRNNSFWKDHLLVFYPITVIILVVDIQDAIIVVIQVVHIIAGSYDVFLFILQ